MSMQRVAPRASGDAPLRIETIADDEAFARLAPAWSELLGASAANNPFLSFEWLFSWWMHLGAGGELRLELVSRGEQAIGVAPFALARASLERLPPVPALQFLGSGAAGSDYLDLIVRRGYECEVVDALCRRMSESGRTLALMRIPPDGPAALLVARMRARGWRAWEGPKEICPIASLREQSFESYLASLGAEHRYAFRRKLGRIERRSARFELVHTEAERPRALATLFALHDRRWRARRDAGAFSTQALRDFHDRFTRLALSAGWLRLWVLHLEGRPAAALYGLLYRGTFYFYQAGFDPAFARDSVGLVLLGVAVRAAIADGATELDLLHGTERYKAHWTHEARELARFELFAPGARGLLASEASAWTRRARRLARGVIALGSRSAPVSQSNHDAKLD